MHGAQFAFQHYQAMCVYMCVLFGVPMLRRFFVKYRIACYWYSHVTFLYLCQNRKNLILSNVTEERTVDAALYTGSTGGKTITTAKRVPRPSHDTWHPFGQGTTGTIDLSTARRTRAAHDEASWL
jgi:hypothetical protein